jgi:hypothetical protein
VGCRFFIAACLHGNSSQAKAVPDLIRCAGVQLNKRIPLQRTDQILFVATVARAPQGHATLTVRSGVVAFTKWGGGPAQRWCSGTGALPAVAE